MSKAVLKSTYTTPAICLWAKDYRDNDRLVSYYTPEQGKISAIVPGARRAKSKLSGASETMAYVQLHLAKGRNLDSVRQYESLQSFSGLRGELGRLAGAMACTELVNITATEEEPDSDQLFELLIGSLRRLDQPPAMGEDEALPYLYSCVSGFMMGWLHIHGYFPTLDQCVISQQDVDLSAPWYHFLPDLGGVVDHAMAHQSEIVAQRAVKVRTSTLILLKDALLENPQLPTPLHHTDDLAAPQRLVGLLRLYCQGILHKPLPALDFLEQVTSDPKQMAFAPN